MEQCTSGVTPLTTGELLWIYTTLREIRICPKQSSSFPSCFLLFFSKINSKYKGTLILLNNEDAQKVEKPEHSEERFFFSTGKIETISQAMETLDEWISWEHL